ncbi:MAG: hypothetical protein M3R68_00075 [Acidobacteriota bacterium]|nr:hypothetical protein [Acidobacteriota bacterium]
MFAVIKRFLGRLFSRRRNVPPAAPPDPYAFQPVSKKPVPNDRSGAVAVLETEDGEAFADPVGYFRT